MRAALRNLFLASAVFATAVLSTGAARAENRFDVPFSFYVGGTQCPAGEYTLQHSGIGDMVTLWKVGGSRNFSWVLSPGDPSPEGTRVVLLFDRFGSRYALRSVEYRGLTTRELDTKMQRMEYVKTKQIPSTTKIAAGR